MINTDRRILGECNFVRGYVKPLVKKILWGTAVGAGLVMVATVLYGIGEIRRADARKERLRVQAELERSAGEEFARCSAGLMTKQAMRDLVLSEYRHNGLDWQERLSKWNELKSGRFGSELAQAVAAQGPTPDLEAFGRRQTGFGWPHFQLLKERCGGSLPLTSLDPWAFWQTLEVTEPFATELAQVRARDDAILRQHREELERRRAADKEKSAAFLFKKP